MRKRILAIGAAGVFIVGAGFAVALSTTSAGSATSALAGACRDTRAAISAPTVAEEWAGLGMVHAELLTVIGRYGDSAAVQRLLDDVEVAEAELGRGETPLPVALESDCP